MPNWCQNHLRIHGPESDVQRFKTQAQGHSPWREAGETAALNPLNFHNLVPIPTEVLQAGYGEAGYDWELAHWGCKWGAYDMYVSALPGDGLPHLIAFCTPNSEPTPMIPVIVAWLKTQGIDRVAWIVCDPYDNSIVACVE